MAFVTEYYLDGRVKSVTGTGVVHKYYNYGVNSGGTQWTCIWKGNAGAGANPDTWTPGSSGPGSAEWVETTTYDFFGRIKKVEKPGYSSATAATEYFYNDKGQLWKTTTTGSAPTLYEHDEMGSVTRSGLDVNGNDVLDLASQDRITETATFYEQDGSSDWWHVTERKVYPNNDQVNVITISTTKRRLTGHGTGIVQETSVLDANDNPTTTTVAVDRPNKQVTRTVDHPDSTTNEVTITQNGLLTSSTSKIGVTRTYGYDGLGRRKTVADPRTGTTTTTYDTAGRVWTIQGPDPTIAPIEYGYNAQTGKMNWIKNALGKYHRFEYSDRGELVRKWGDTVYPVEYEYDSCGRRTKMWTWRDGTINWAGTTWPSPPAGDQTTWIYEPGTGLLLEKQYADHATQPPRNIEYTYTAEGKLKTRKWSRSGTNGRIVTTYAYDSNTGDLESISYNDGATPGVTFEYERLGQQDTITDATGTWTFAWNPSTLQLVSETAEATGLYGDGFRLWRHYADSGPVIGRDVGFRIGLFAYGGQMKIDYHYDAVGRLERIAGASGWPATGLPAYGVEYEYEPDSNLVKAIRYKSDSTTTLASTALTYEDDRDLIQTVENKRDADNPATTISKYQYASDTVARRTSVANTGEAFATDAFSVWHYNDRSELTGSWRGLGGTVQDPPTNEVTPERRLYNYDPIGNRKDSTEGTTSGTVYYCANNVNQYTFTHDGTGSCPPVTPTFTYDEDGNLTQDGQFVYTWDAENRLITVAPASSPVNGDKKVEFKYDYMNRRVEKKVYTYSEGWGSPTELLRFVYDQWNLVLILDGLDGNVPLKKYAWGLDLSGRRGNARASGIHRAGGIGGLLAAEEISGTYAGSYWFFYDANGNVGQVVENTAGYPVVGHYEYDAYGNVLGTPTGYATDNPFRSSTKWFDTESGLYYFGKRYLRPAYGRWANRDPMHELGGLNLYVAFLNAPTIRFDPLGEKDCLLIDYDGTMCDLGAVWPECDGPSPTDLCGSRECRRRDDPSLPPPLPPNGNPDCEARVFTARCPGSLLPPPDPERMVGKVEKCGRCERKKGVCENQLEPTIGLCSGGNREEQWKDKKEFIRYLLASGHCDTVYLVDDNDEITEDESDPPYDPDIPGFDWGPDGKPDIIHCTPDQWGKCVRGCTGGS